VVIPSTANLAGTYTVTGTFIASCESDYYLEAYQDINSKSPLSVVTSSLGKCDQYPGTAGTVVHLAAGGRQDFAFTLHDYGSRGVYTVVVGAYNGCQNMLVNDWKIYDSKTSRITIDYAPGTAPVTTPGGAEDNPGGAEDNQPPVNTVGGISMTLLLWIGGAALVVLVFTLIIARRKK
jgi:hypothetical protein